MTRTSPRSLRMLAGTSVAVLVIAACGGSEDSASDAVVTSSNEAAATDPDTSVDTTPPETTTTVAELTTATAVAPVETEPVDTEPIPVETEPAPVETDPGGGTLPDCLVGDWIVNDAEMNAYYMALGDNSGAGLEITADGNMLITMTETDYIFTGNYTVNIDVAGQTGMGVATGTASGNWTVDDGVIQSELIDSNLDIDVTVGGVSFDGSDIGNSLLRSDPFANTPVSCDGPTLMFQAGATEDVRHPVVLSPV